jgi:hypothetical protein
MGQLPFDKTQTRLLSLAYQEALLRTDLRDGSPEAAALAQKIIHLFMVGEKDHKRLGRQAAAIRLDLALVLGLPEVPHHVIELVTRPVGSRV